MKKQLNQLRRFFARTGTRKLNAATAREVIPASYDDDDNSNRLSGAFIVVLALHVIALVGVFAFSRMKDPRSESASGPSQQAEALAGAPAAAPVAEARSAEPVASTDPLTTPAPELRSDGAQMVNVNSTSGAQEFPAVERSSEGSRPASRGNDRVYIVKSGDNLTKIAVAYGVRPSDLMSENNLKSDEIRPGQELAIPDPKAIRVSTAQTAAAKPVEKAVVARPTPTSYKVRKNDTLVKIARELGVRYEELTKLNNIKDPRKLQEGQILKVPKKS